MAQYEHLSIEKKWQKRWAETQNFKAQNNSEKKKYYVLDMFPYPSGAGLHVGHPLGYIASDIFSRYKRHQGFNVLHPMGYDAFGLPAEQYAIQTGQHPEKTTKENILRYREQLDRIGFSFDWSREVITCEPQYYKWTQWIFIQLFNSYYNTKLDKAESITVLISKFEKEGFQSEDLSFTNTDWLSFSEKKQSDILLKFRLAFLSETMVNWCPALGSVLANDEIKDGVSERGGYPVERKLMYQWSLRISAYSERLLQDLDTIEWSDSLKESQRNWIGKSEGCSLKFDVASSSVLDEVSISLEVFTTRPDTVFGVSFLAIAPEHTLLKTLCVGDQKEAALLYAEKAKNKSERERQTEIKNITGAFTGSYAVHPFTSNKIQIWVADYVLGGYGTGAVMAVPAHDSRDYAFAKYFDLPILEVVSKEKSDTLKNVENGLTSDNTSPLPLSKHSLDTPRRGELDSDSPFGYYTTDKVLFAKLIDFAKSHRSSPTKEEEKVWEIIRNKQINETKFRRQHIIDKFIVDFVCLDLNLIVEIDGLIHSLEDNIISDEARTIRLNELGFEVLRFKNEEINNNIENVISMLKKSISERRMSSPSHLEKGLGDEVDEMQAPYEAKQGTIINSDFLNGLEVKQAIKKAIEAIEDKKIGKGKTNFRLRDAVFGRQRYWGEPIPVYYENDVPKTMDINDLPLVLPEIDKYLPTETGEPPLSRAKDWSYKGFPLETTTMPGWAGSSWYYLRYMDPGNENALASKEAIDYWQNIDLYLGGSEHATGHLLYFRFWCKFLYDLGIVPFNEPAKKLVNQGMIQGQSSIIYRVNGTQKFVTKFLKDSYETSGIYIDISVVKNHEVDIDALKKWRPSEFDGAEFELEDGKLIADSETGKMSKRWHNVVNPDDICNEHGADTLRLYEMFLGPLQDPKPWSTQGIEGVPRFLRKLWRLFHSAEGESFMLSNTEPSKAELKVLHKTIKKATEDIENFSFNTSVSAFMVCVNELQDLKCNNRTVLESLIILISPYAPHICEELWELSGHSSSIEYATWPTYNPDFLVENEFNYPVSFNGKVRFNLNFALNFENSEIEAVVIKNENTIKYLDGKPIKKVIVVKGKIINIVI